MSRHDPFIAALLISAGVIALVVVADVALSIAYGHTSPGTYTVLLSVITWAGGHGSGLAIGAKRSGRARSGDKGG